MHCSDPPSPFVGKVYKNVLDDDNKKHRYEIPGVADKQLGLWEIIHKTKVQHAQFEFKKWSRWTCPGELVLPAAVQAN